MTTFFAMRQRLSRPERTAITALTTELVSGLVTFLVKLTFIKGNNTNLDFHHVSLMIRL